MLLFNLKHNVVTSGLKILRFVTCRQEASMLWFRLVSWWYVLKVTYTLFFFYLLKYLNI